MKRIFLIAVASAALAPLVANAENERMSDARYLAASRCLAYADLPELQSDGANFSALRAAASVGFHSSSVVSDARENAARVRAQARRLSGMNNGLQQLRGERDAACTGFVERGLVQIEASRAPS
ncbi:MAG: hypothetical protein JSS00_06400 [Proteobacteria bacterium]|nr:hypothetical protein [Pseudomonadota bacterium]